MVIQQPMSKYFYKIKPDYVLIMKSMYPKSIIILFTKMMLDRILRRLTNREIPHLDVYVLIY
jgi:hypothetical protein